MKTFVITTLKIICVVGFLYMANSCAKVEKMREVENNQHIQKQAPNECIAVFREFFDYVKKGEKISIVTDGQAQNRWLSERLRKSFVGYIKRSGSPSENHDYPSNKTFLGVWNKPTTYSIIGSRHYDYRNADNPDDNRAVVDVLYEWDTYTDGIENQ